MAIVSYIDFVNNYLIKDGMIGKATNMNKAADQLKKEIDEVIAGNKGTDILTKLKTVDGTGSGLDADLLNGKNSATTNIVNTIVARDGTGNFSAGTITAGKFNMQKASGGVASITIADGVSNTAVVLPESGTVATTSNIVGFKNYIINGGFDVWQRGTSFTATTAFAYMADRFRIKTTSGTCSVIKSPNGMPTEYTQSLSKTNYITISSNNNGEIEMSQPIEDVRTLAGKNVTVSFNAAIYQGSDKNINISIMQFFGTGGSAPVYTNIKTISVKTSVGATAVDRYNATFNLPPIAGKTITSDSQLILIVRIPNGSYNFDIGKVQLEEVSVATPFEN